MMKNFEKVLIFVAGLAIGSVATWKFVETKYKKIAQEEIDSVKDIFSKKKEQHDEVDEKEPVGQKNPYFAKYKDTVVQYGYKIDENKQEGGSEMIGAPHVIPPEEFDTKPDYETVSLTYYADNVLTDEMDDVIEDIDDRVGEDSLTHFGEYEDDSVFVRNDLYKIDYEILLDDRNYYDCHPDPSVDY